MKLWAPGRKGMSILDASAGPGHSTKALVELGFDVTATNYGAERDPRIDEAAAYVGGVDLNRGLPFGDESFDGAHLQEVIEHLENPAATIREFSRVLKPGGLLVISTPNILNASARARFALTGFLEGIKRPVSYAKAPGNADNIYMTNLPQLHYLMAWSGMSIEEMALGPYTFSSLILAVAMYPAIWLGTVMATTRPRKKDLLMKDDRLKASDELLSELQLKQVKVQKRIRHLLLSKEALLGKSLMIRARKTGIEPFEA